MTFTAPFFGVVTATVTTTTTTTDDYGDTTSTTEDVEIPGCLFAPERAVESPNSASPNRMPAQLYIPADSPVIHAADKVTIPQGVFDVDGEPEVWGGAGVVVNLRRWS